MTHLVKMGDQYLTADGSWSDRQKNALRVDMPPNRSARSVRLRPHGSVALSQLPDPNAPDPMLGSF